MIQNSLQWHNGAKLRTDDGTELFYRSLIPVHPKLIMIFIHGAGQHSGLFMDLGVHCKRHDIAYYALDLRGFGESSGQRGHVQSFSEYLQDLGMFIQYVKQKHPVHPVFLMGHSLGGTIVIRYGEEHPGCVQGVILCAPAIRPRLEFPRSLYLLCHLLSLLTPTFCLEVQKWSKYGSMIRTFAPFFRYIANEDQDALSTDRFSVRWCMELLENGQNALREADKFNMSLLSLCGADDPLIQPAAVLAFHHKVPVQDKKFLVFPRRKHRLLEGADREFVYDYIVNWLHQRA